MFELQILFQRRRKMLTRAGALIVLGLAGLLAVLPRADAHDAQHVASIDSRSLLLSPEPMAGRRFAAFYEMSHR